MTAMPGCRRRPCGSCRPTTRPPGTPAGQVTRWAGYLAQVTETCSGDSPNVITDVAIMPATSDDTAALPGIQKYLDHHDIPRLRSWRAVS
jgi:hypothetical protein